MKTTVKFNKGNQSVEVTMIEKLQLAKSENLIAYIEETLAYQDFCKNQTKKGQARKNERARARQKYNTVSLSEEASLKLKEIHSNLFNEKDALIEKVTVEITFDGRKKRNLSRIIEGVKMCYFVGGISQQHYSLGLIDAQIK